MYIYTATCIYQSINNMYVYIYVYIRTYFMNRKRERVRLKPLNKKCFNDLFVQNKDWLELMFIWEIRLGC